MKKILATSLIGVLSLLIQVNATAEETATEPTESTATAPETAPSSAAIAVEETVEVVVEVEVEEKAKPQSAVLGESMDVYSLRGDTGIDDESVPFPNRRIMVVDGGIDVTFGDQPPMVPHSIDKDRISLQENTCLKCHSKADSKLESAPKPTPSHFKGRDGEKKSEVVPNRYFCTQCHMPQANIKPLIKNNFTD